MVKAKEVKGASLRAETFSDATGLLNDVDVVLSNMQATYSDFNGYLDEKVPVLSFTMTCKETGTEEQVLLSVGKATHWQPSADGKEFVPDEGGRKFNRGTNMGAFMSSLVDSGVYDFLPDLGTDVTALNGLVVHIIRRARQGKPAEGFKGKAQLVVEEVKGIEGSGRSSKKSAASDDIVQEAEAVISKILVAKGPMSKNDALAGLLNETAKPGVVKAVMAKGFLESADRPWSFDASTGNLSIVPF